MKKIAAKWTPDCSGKQDFDGRIISISTRYYPRGGGFMLMNRTEDGVTIEENEDRPEIKPSASAAIHLDFFKFYDGEDEPDDDYIELVNADFEADTEEEVKAQVERWAQEQFEVIALAMQEEAPLVKIYAAVLKARSDRVQKAEAALKATQRRLRLLMEVMQTWHEDEVETTRVEGYLDNILKLSQGDAP